MSQQCQFADDTAIVSLLEGDKTTNGQVMADFVTWCHKSFLQLNVSKTKYMVIDFRKSLPSPPSTFLKAAAIEMLDSH